MNEMMQMGHGCVAEGDMRPSTALMRSGSTVESHDAQFVCSAIAMWSVWLLCADLLGADAALRMSAGKPTSACRIVPQSRTYTPAYSTHKSIE